MDKMARLKENGFTLIEIIVVLGIVAVLTAILLPIVTSYLNDAKVARAAKDATSIATAILKFEGDVGEWPRWVDGTKTKDTDARFIVLYTKDGKAVEATVDGTKWNKGANDDDNPIYAGGSTPGTGTPSNGDGDILDHHLSENAPGGTTDVAKKYKKWEGSYLSVPKADPWGNKYYVNVQFLAGQAGDAVSGDKGRHAFVLSAGPDGVINTAFDQASDSILVVDGDDIVIEIK